MNARYPTEYAELNHVLREFVESVQFILKDNFLSAILQGSFAIGGWDADSDVDFLIAVKNELVDSELQALQAMHARIYRMDSDWAKHLEGSYFPKNILKSADPARKQLWYLDNTFDRLMLSDHDNTLVVRWVAREHGITLAGAPAQDIIDFVSAGDLRKEILFTMEEWTGEIESGQWKMDNQWAQPFAVIMYCRMLHSLQTGRIASKFAGVQWALQTLDPRWTGLIQRAWHNRPDPSRKVRLPADHEEVVETAGFIRYATRMGLSLVNRNG